MTTVLASPETSPPAGAAPLRVEIIGDVEGLRRLEPAWRDLSSRVPYWSASQLYEYTATAWEVMPKDAGCSLAVIAVWRGARLAGVWPLYVRREGLVTIATHPGLGDSGEYAGPTISDAEPGKVAELALKEARGLADVLQVFALHSGSPLAPVIARMGGLKYSNNLLSPVVAVTACETFDAWLATKSGSFRAELRNDRKRMAAQGALEFVRMMGPDDGPALVDWLFEIKKEWLAARNISESWILQSQGRDLCKALISEPDGPDAEARPFQAFALRLDGKIAAGCICYRSSDVLEYYMTGFDPAFRAYSPGNLLIEDLARWSLRQGLDFDFRITRDAYKMRWQGRDVAYETHIVACTPKGAPRVLRFEANRVVRKIRMALGPMIKRWRKPRKKNKA